MLLPILLELISDINFNIVKEELIKEKQLTNDKFYEILT